MVSGSVPRSVMVGWAWAAAAMRDAVSRRSARRAAMHGAGTIVGLSGASIEDLLDRCTSPAGLICRARSLSSSGERQAGVSPFPWPCWLGEHERGTGRLPKLSPAHATQRESAPATLPLSQCNLRAALGATAAGVSSQVVAAVAMAGP